MCIRDSVSRVPAPAHAGLEDRHVDPLSLEVTVGDRGDDLEVSKGFADLGLRFFYERHYLSQGLGELVCRYELAVDRYPLADRFEVRRGEEPGAKPAPLKDRGDHPRDRGLTVRAGDLDRVVCVLGTVHQPREGTDAVERRLDPKDYPAV